MERDGSEEIATCLVTLPPTQLQRWSAFSVCVVFLLGLGILAPFADVPLPRITAFIPSFEAIIFVSDFITSVLLFSQFSIYRSRALLALASGYLFTALIIVPHVLTYPGVFSPTGLLGAGLSTTSWLYWFWHIGFPVALLAYAWLKDEKATASQVSTLYAVGWSVVLVCALVFGLTWLTTVGEPLLPQLFTDVIHLTPFNHYLLMFGILICVSALALLWTRRRSVLDLWLMVVAIAAISELGLVALTSARFELGFYAGRLFSLVTSATVLVVLLAETSRLYARLAHSHLMLQRERQNKLMNLEAMAASISHEVRQPLTSIATNGRAAQRFLGHLPPNVEEAQSALNRLIGDSHRASQVFENIRALFGKADEGHKPIDVNRLIRDVITDFQGDLEQHGIIVSVRLPKDLPKIAAHKGQLQQVLINLVRNAIEAMEADKSDHRALLVSSGHHGADEIILSIEDSGPGIDPKHAENIFDAFVTTKSHGMGLGLALCRMIIEQHSGELSASPAHPRGSVFRIVLPILLATK
jgi:signal transduction histidine kinase